MDELKEIEGSDVYQVMYGFRHGSSDNTKQQFGNLVHKQDFSSSVFESFVNYYNTHGRVDSFTNKDGGLTSLVNNARPIVFHNDNSLLVNASDLNSEHTEIDTPFEETFIEMRDLNGRVIPIFTFFMNKYNNDPAYVMGIGIKETNVKKYNIWFYALQFIKENNVAGCHPMYTVIPYFESEYSYNFICNKIGQLLKLLSLCDVGCDKPGLRVKIKNDDGSKKIRKITNVTNVIPTKLNTTISDSRKYIDWSHRWEVRGHWRRLPDPTKMGNNRHGERIVQGHTWISNYVKGPEIAPLVKKTRVLK